MIESTKEVIIMLYCFIGLLVPFIGTTLGSSLVFFIKDKIPARIQKLLLGFASGVMIAASVWSLLIPAMNQASYLDKWAFLPASIGLVLGVLFLLFLDENVPHLHVGANDAEGRKSGISKQFLMIFAVALHNIPEGMAVGIVFAGMLQHAEGLTLASALALSIGIAIQNFPEGAIISLPLKSEGISKKKSFLLGVLSGIVEPIGGLITIWLSSYIQPLLPYLLAFAAGAMIYVVVEELIPQASIGKHSNIATIGFTLGFVIMMILDVALG